MASEDLFVSAPVGYSSIMQEKTSKPSVGCEDTNHRFVAVIRANQQQFFACFR
jgi:hypothetical protein